MHRIKLVSVVIITIGIFGTVSACPDQLDVAFVIDGSGSVGSSNWMIIQDFLVDVIMRFQVGSANVRVGMVTYGASASTIWNLNSFNTQTASRLAQAVGQIVYPGGATATPYGLQHATTNVLPTNRGGRDAVQNVVVVITDGKSNRPTSNTQGVLRNNAAALKRIARVVVIGVANYDRSELELIATSRCDVFTVADFSQMNNNMPDRMDQICGCMPGYRRSSSCQCVACQMSMYQPEWGQTECLDCPQNFTGMSSMASMQCIPDCPPGSMIDTTGQRCELCPQDTYQSQSAQSRCFDCPRGTATRKPGATSRGECEVICEPGEQPNAFGSCEPCPHGTYQPSAFSTMCIPCPEGYNTTATGSVSMAQCIAICPEGQFAGSNNMCNPCPIRMYQDMTVAVTCQFCPNGTSTRQEGAMSIMDCGVICEPGTHANEDETECLPCDEGYYQDQEFMLFCIKCPSGTDAPRPGMTTCPQTAESDDGMDDGEMAGMIVGIVLFLALILILLLVCLCCWRKRAYARSAARAEGLTIENANYTGFIATAKKKLTGVFGRDSKKGDNDYSPEPTKASIRTTSDYDEVYAIDEKNDMDITDHVYDNQGAGDYDTPPAARKVGSGLDHTYANAR